MKFQKFCNENRFLLNLVKLRCIILYTYYLTKQTYKKQGLTYKAYNKYVIIIKSISLCVFMNCVGSQMAKFKQL